MSDKPEETNNQNTPAVAGEEMHQARASIHETGETVYEAGEIRPKSVKICYLLCLFFGIIGVHKIYLDQTGKAGLYMVLLLFAIFQPVTPIILAIFLVQDFLSIPLQVRLYNEELPEKLRRQRELKSQQLQHKLQIK